MFLSKHKSGYYYIYYTNKQTLSRRSISSRTKLKSEALSFLSDFKNKLKEQRKNGVILISLEDFCQKFLYYSSSIHTSKTTSGYQNTFNQLKKNFGNTTLTNLSSSLINDYLKYRITSSSVYAARKDLINLSSAFKKAITDNHLKENPCDGIKRIKIPEKQLKFFKKEEYLKLLKVIDDEQFRNMIEVSIDTGLRQMELLIIKWEHVNLEDKLITLNNHGYITKGKRVRSIPMTRKVYEILNEMFKEKKKEYVFIKDGEKYRQNYVTKKFKSYVRLVDINQRLNWHSLRHSFASWLVQRNVSIYQVSKLLGHQDIKTTEIYAHVRNEDLREAINILNN
jgi:site-specific recombinase XerD